MAASRSIKFFLPGVFLLALGLGNIAVGTLKGYQYDRMLTELETQENDPDLDAMAPLARIQADNGPEARLYKSVSYAEARKDFYDLVTLGGEVLVLLSAVFLAISALCKLRYPSPIPPAAQSLP